MCFLMNDEAIPVLGSANLLEHLPHAKEKLLR